MLPANAKIADENTLTMFRLVRGSLDGTPRLRSDSYEAPSTGRLDRVPTRTRLARQGISTIGKSLTRTTQSRTTRPILFTYSEIKVRPFNATTCYFLPSWLQSWPSGNSTGVKSHFLPPIPGWEVKTYHYTHQTAHCFATDHP
jgi:hypothetical protein